MANAKKCERCGRLYEEKELGSLVELAKSLMEFNSKFTPTVRCDLCDECKRSFDEWWKEGEE